MADADLYDEFGNYIGPELSGSEDDDYGAQPPSPGGGGDGSLPPSPARDAEASPPPPASTAVVLHEDKQYYPSAEDVYGPGTEALVMEEDAQPIEVPILAPTKTKRVEAAAPAGRVPRADAAFAAGLAARPALVRSVAVLGGLHAGKTALADAFYEAAFTPPPRTPRGAAARAGPRDQGSSGAPAPLRFTDARIDEQARGVSVKATAACFVVPDSRGKSRLLQIVDAPGHPDFDDEVVAAARLADGGLLCVDAAEGVTAATHAAARAAAAAGLPLCLVITKCDRLILELKLPPADAYHKLRHVLDEANAAVVAAGGGAPGGGAPFDPRAGNVAFAAPAYGWAFTLASVAALHADVWGPDAPLDAAAFAARLWGDVYCDDEGVFSRAPPSPGAPRTFVQYVLDPLYKLHSHILADEVGALSDALAGLGVALPPSAAVADVKPLLAAAAHALLGGPECLVDMVVARLPSPAAGAATKLGRLFAAGPASEPALAAASALDPAAPLLAVVVKLVPKPDATGFDALTRVLAGTLRPGDRVRVLGPSFTRDDDEDCAPATVARLWTPVARVRVPVDAVPPGAWALVEGVDASITGAGATLAAAAGDPPPAARPLPTGAASVVKLACEPLNPGELPAMVAGLRGVAKSYPSARVRVEESGEHVLLGPGELMLDSAMKDLRELFGDVEVKVADPSVALCETVVEASAITAAATSANGANTLSMVAEPLPAALVADIEAGAIDLTAPRKRVADFLSTKHGWDALAARSVWAFGPDASTGPNALLDDTLPDDTDKSLLAAVRSSIVQGFQWGAREGPLCDEPLRGVKLRLLRASLADAPLARGGGQIIPAARRAGAAAVLTATPRLMEPLYDVEITAPADAVPAVYAILGRRRGAVTADAPRAGTPVFRLAATLPVLESFGFETDVRVATQGHAFPLSTFAGWGVVPGDPLDRSIVLRPLEPSAPAALARELMVKTRRRKGLVDDVSLGAYFDADALAALAAADVGLAVL